MFQKFASLTRFSQDWTVTEKIDGTNGQLFIDTDADCVDGPQIREFSLGQHDGFHLLAGSRTRFLTPKDDNHGFARWAEGNAEVLIKALGQGRHYGEWWGKGIQRNYSLPEKRFSLFNVSRWKQEELPEGLLYVVPSFCIGEYFDVPGGAFKDAMNKLRKEGSLASPGFMDPEGIVMFHGRSRTLFKKTFDYDEKGKWAELTA